MQNLDAIFAPAVQAHRWVPFKSACGALKADGWASPDTYAKDFRELRPVSAVYILLAVKNDYFDEAMVAYVGMTSSASQRLANHPVADEVRKIGGVWVMRWFRREPMARLSQIERDYIRRLDPPWNTIGRARGGERV